MRLDGFMTNITALHPGLTSGTWKLDPAHSELTFSVRHLAISKVRGVFENWDVTVNAADTLEDSSAEATIEVSSVNTKQEQRDAHLRTSDFFKVDEHPTMTFKSTKLTVDGDDFTLVGDLTLRGITKSVTLKGEFGGVTTDNTGRTKAGASAKTKFNRQDFGVSWNAAVEAGGFTLGDEVTVNVDLQVDLQK